MDADCWFVDSYAELDSEADVLYLFLIDEFDFVIFCTFATLKLNYDS